MTKIISFGELLIDFVPTVNGVSLAEAPAFKKAPGGAPANVAAGLAKLGIDVAFLGKVGDDEFGHMLEGVIKEVGVDTSMMRFDTKALTALAFVTLKANGEREFMFYRHPSADMLLTEDEVDMQRIRDTEIFVYGSIPLITDPTRSTLLKILGEAKRAGVFCCYDPNLRLSLWENAQAAKDGILSIWESADMIKISDEELEFLTGKGSDSAARSLMFDRLKLLLVTEGPDGARYYTPDFAGKVAGLKVDAVDTTGAGDAFVAGFLSKVAADRGVLDDESKLQAAIRFANVAGAITTTGRGAIPSLPTVEQILEAESL